jgi:excisionase family DNA binding protein
MSTEVQSFEQMIEGILRKVVREELQSAAGDDRLLSPEQVAEWLSYSVHQVHRLKREKKLNGFMLGDNSLRFRRSEIERFIREREQTAA